MEACGLPTRAAAVARPLRRAGCVHHRNGGPVAARPTRLVGALVPARRRACLAVRSVEVDQQEEEAAAAMPEVGAAQEEAPKVNKNKPETVDLGMLRVEVQRRRNFAIISHPDAGKTTLTEKLLYYGGAIQQAGEVKARKSDRHAKSDWMELEKQRGISITSTALTFDYDGKHINILDTPGHQDFSEDTYRTLSAADNTVMLVDGAKGIEPQTRKLFEVARLRNLPIFTFVNKLDRPALEPLEIIDQLEAEFGLASFPMNWPIGSGDRFAGVFDRVKRQVVLFGKKGTNRRTIPEGDPELDSLLDAELWAEVQEEIELLDELGAELDLDAVYAGELTPMYFGSAMSNFGVQDFLESFISIAQTPCSASTVDGGTCEPVSPHFSGQVFKLQANMDPKHRDKVAYVRVWSGKFEKGMKLQVARTGRTVTASRPQKMMGDERQIVEDSFAGDVIGLTNPGAFAIGDTLYAGPERRFAPIPSFSPSLFAYLKASPGSRKGFLKGLEGLLGEGAVQVLYSNDDFITDPILAAVGELQFEVVQYRMKSEYNVDTKLEHMPYGVARWVEGGWEEVERLGRVFNSMQAKDQWGRPVLLFKNDYALQQLLADEPDVQLSSYALPPSY